MSGHSSLSYPSIDSARTGFCRFSLNADTYISVQLPNPWVGWLIKATSRADQAPKQCATALLAEDIGLLELQFRIPLYHPLPPSLSHFAGKLQIVCTP